MLWTAENKPLSFVLTSSPPPQSLDFLASTDKMGSYILDLLESPARGAYSLSIVALLGSVAYLVIYVVYQRFFHPLARYPGPFIASITDLWQVCEFLSLKQPYNLTKLHEKYGQFVRYGPDKISTTAEDAIPTLYQKGGKMMPKTEFYDAYGAAHPNVFGMRDEAVGLKILSIYA